MFSFSVAENTEKPTLLVAVAKVTITDLEWWVDAYLGIVDI